MKTADEEKNKHEGEKTIRAETTRVFVLVFSLLATLGIFEMVASYSGAQRFQRINDIHFKAFQLANTMSEEASDLVGVFYLAAGENDTDLQLEHMVRYNKMIESFGKAHASFEEILKEVADSEAKRKSLEFVQEIKKSFAAINISAQGMMLASMEGRKDDAKSYFFQVNRQIAEFKEQIQALKNNERSQLDLEVDTAQRSLKRTTIVATVLTFGSIILTLFLINHLMRFLAVSLLPISNLMHNLREAVFSVDASGKIQAPVSKFSSNLFEEEIVGRFVTESIYQNSGLDEKKLAELSQTMQEAFGRDAKVWDQLKSRFPKSLQRKFGVDRIKSLSFTYTPLWDELGNLQHIMFVVEDDTEVESLREKERKLELDALSRQMEAKRKGVELAMQAENLKLAQEKNKVLMSLRLEAESKFSLASEVAHRLNNPLNYIKTSLMNISSIRSDLWQKSMLLLQPDGEDSPELVMVRNEYTKIFSDLDQSIGILSTGVDKAAEYIGDIRGLSGVDGFAIERVELNAVWQKVRHRLVEVLDNASFERLKFTIDDKSQMNYYCNKYLFKLCLEMVLRFVCTQTSEQVFANLVVEGSEHSLKLVVKGKVGKITTDQWQALEANVSRILRAARTDVSIEPHLFGVDIAISQQSVVATTSREAA